MKIGNFICDFILHTYFELQEDASVTESPNVIPESDSDESVDTEMCEKCGKEVSPFEMPEHLDFHYAQEMELREKEIFASDQAVKRRPAPLKDSSSEEEESEDEDDSEHDGKKLVKTLQFLIKQSDFQLTQKLVK